MVERPSRAPFLQPVEYDLLQQPLQTLVLPRCEARGGQQEACAVSGEAVSLRAASGGSSRVTGLPPGYPGV